MQLTMFDLFDEMLRESSSGKTSRESFPQRTTPSAAFLAHLPGKMSRSSHQGKNGQTLVVCMVPKEQLRGESSTPNISEWPNDAVVCSLSQVLEQTSIPQRYFLSSTACAGILRRAEKRGKALPAALMLALTAVSESKTQAQDLSPVTTHRMVAFGEYSDDGTASAMKARDYKDATDLVAQTFSTPAIGHIVEDDVASTMTKNTGGGGETQNPAFVAQPVAYTTKLHNTTSNQAGKFYEEYSTSLDANSPPPAVFQPISIQDVRPVEKAQNGKGSNDDGTAYTVDTHATQGVAQPIVFDTTNITSPENGSNPQPGDPCFTLAKGQHPPLLTQPVAFQQTAGCLTAAYGTKWNGNASATNGSLFAAQPYIGGVDYENNAHTMDQPTGPLLKGSPTGGGRPLPAIATAMQVRRLTPVECERLQGFPDNYTNIPWRKKLEAPDGPRYKALGNSWAVPVVAWIGHRIQQELNK